MVVYEKRTFGMNKIKKALVETKAGLLILTNMNCKVTKKMIEVTPIDDIEQHESGSTCKCQPRVIFENGEMIVIHSSFDGREAVEEFYAALNKKNE
tara:strand:+ start:201 stop:488 length:288 start_codon:yes stop_codon:yes gene_type:complete